MQLEQIVAEDDSENGSKDILSFTYPSPGMFMMPRVSSPLTPIVLFDYFSYGTDGVIYNNLNQIINRSTLDDVRKILGFKKLPFSHFLALKKEFARKNSSIVFSGVYRTLESLNGFTETNYRNGINVLSGKIEPRSRKFFNKGRESFTEHIEKKDDSARNMAMRVMFLVSLDETGHYTDNSRITGVAVDGEKVGPEGLQNPLIVNAINQFNLITDNIFSTKDEQNIKSISYNRVNEYNYYLFTKVLKHAYVALYPDVINLTNVRSSEGKNIKEDFRIPLHFIHAWQPTKLNS